MKVALYCRVSTNDGRQTTENQLMQLRTFAANQSWAVVAEYIDECSGKTANRGDFKELFIASSRREFDTVLFWSLDRFSREGALATLQHLQRLTDYGIGYRSFSEPYLDSCGMFKDAVISILAVIAKQERIRMSERVRAGQERYKTEFERGKAQSHSGQNAALGRPKVIINREKVRQMRAEGVSIRQIAKSLKVSVGTVASICSKNPPEIAA